MCSVCNRKETHVIVYFTVVTCDDSVEVLFRNLRVIKHDL